MRPILLGGPALLIALSGPLAPALTGRVYFDLAGGDGDTGPHPGVTAKTNPVAQSGQRLYIYYEFGDDSPDLGYQHVYSANFDIEVEDGIITRAWYYNHPNIGHTGLSRWNVSQPNYDTRVDAPVVTFLASSINQFGLHNGPQAVQLDTQHAPGDGPAGSTLLGYIEVEPSTPGVRAEVFMSLNALGFVIRGGGLGDQIYFGFGDEQCPLVPPCLPDAYVVPEPSTLVLATLGLGWAWRYRRR